MNKVQLNDIERIIGMGDRFLEVMESRSRLPSREKQVKLYKMGEAEKLLGKHRTTIVAAEEKGIISETIKTKGGHRYLTLSQINSLRDHWGIRPWRNELDEALVFGSAVTKGGVGKSVNAVTFAHALAERGYRVLLVDLDPQATSTSANGYIPDHTEKGPGKGIENSMTIRPYMELEEEDLRYAIRDTNWDGLKLIPSNLDTYQLEYSLMGHVAYGESDEDKQAVFRRFKKGIDNIKSDFDIIIIDAPPSFGMIPLSILVAADALLIPSPARMYDFFSTIQFFRMVQETMTTLSPDKEFKWVKVLITQYDHRLIDQQKFVMAMRECFGEFPLSSIFYSSADIQKAASEFKSIFEYVGVRKKTMDMIEPIVDELEALIRSTWKHSPDQVVDPTNTNI
jgi:chromosome partitioning protein